MGLALYANLDSSDFLLMSKGNNTFYIPWLANMVLVLLFILSTSLMGLPSTDRNDSFAGGCHKFSRGRTVHPLCLRSARDLRVSCTEHRRLANTLVLFCQLTWAAI
jgi:hypothetical protein